VRNPNPVSTCFWDGNITGKRNEWCDLTAQVACNDCSGIQPHAPPCHGGGNTKAGESTACAAAITLGANTANPFAAAFETGTQSSSISCGEVNYSGKELMFRITVPPGATLTTSIDTPGKFYAGYELRVGGACPGASGLVCQRSWESNVDGGQYFGYSWANTESEALTVYILVDMYTGQGTSWETTFHLNWNITAASTKCVGVVPTDRPITIGWSGGCAANILPSISREFCPPEREPYAVQVGAGSTTVISTDSLPATPSPPGTYPRAPFTAVESSSPLVPVVFD
jgi:hypothetical protein